MYKILFLVISLNVLLLSQQDSSFYPFRVDSVAVIGNDITEEEIITRELTFSLGESITYEDILYNRERIFSLGIFNRVDIFTDAGDTNILFIDVEESWYIYPLPFAELKDKSWEKVSYGIDVFIRNFRGRNETVRVRAGFGYDPSLYLNYTIPSLTADGNYYLFTDFYYRNVRNKSKYALSLTTENFNQKFLTGLVGLGRRFGIFHRFSLSTGFTYIENPIFVPGISASPDRIDRFPQLGFGYAYDTRDLAQFPKEGILFSIAGVFKGFDINDVNYRIFNLDFREYRQLFGGLVAKWRLAGRFGFGKLIPTYDYSYLGFGDRIRGYYSEEMEGHHLYLASAELAYPIINELRINLDFIPLIPKELLHYRTGLYLNLFTDSGTTKLKNQKISTADFYSGYGAGLTFLILPYNIARVEFAISETGVTEWIFDLGISF
jgi:outer membrane protein assembly factor BamA